MNNPLDFQPKPQPKRYFIVILVIAAGLHLFILSPLLAPYLNLPNFENILTQEPKKSALSVRLIYQKKQVQSKPSNHNKSTNILPVFINDAVQDNALGTNKSDTRFNIDDLTIDITDEMNVINAKGNTDLVNSNLMNEGTFNLELDSNITNNLEDDTDVKKVDAVRDLTDQKTSLSQSLESTQTDSFSEGLENPSSKKDALTDVFSSKTQQQLQQANEEQVQYEEAQTEDVDYAITEDSDGTRYVNIKGVCWRIPPPGSEESWMIVYAGCAGQTRTFNLEINIGMDILGPNSPFAID